MSAPTNLRLLVRRKNSTYFFGMGERSSSLAIEFLLVVIGEPLSVFTGDRTLSGDRFLMRTGDADAFRARFRGGGEGDDSFLKSECKYIHQKQDIPRSVLNIRF